VAGIVVSLLAVFGLCGCSRLAPASSTEPGTRSSGQVVSVADGDTVTVRLDSGRIRSVRLLAIDSPEKYATRYGSTNECGSAAASAFMERFEGRRAMLVSDPSQDRVDRYGRLLRYVQLPGGRDLGAAEVARGLAMPYVFDSPARRYKGYRALAQAARAASRGTWGPPCEGDFHSSVPGAQSDSSPRMRLDSKRVWGYPTPKSPRKKCHSHCSGSRSTNGHFLASCMRSEEARPLAISTPISRALARDASLSSSNTGGIWCSLNGPLAMAPISASSAISKLKKSPVGPVF
jgi:micrococcal nuclease